MALCHSAPAADTHTLLHTHTEKVGDDTHYGDIFSRLASQSSVVDIKTDEICCRFQAWKLSSMLFFFFFFVFSRQLQLFVSFWFCPLTYCCLLLHVSGGWTTMR